MRTAVIYCRISADSEGRGEGVERQEKDCRELAKHLGYAVDDVIVENDTGASARSRKPRPLYAEMVRRAEAGEWDALIGWSTSRFTRQVSEASHLSELRRARNKTGRPLRLLTVKTGEDDDTAFGKLTTGFRALLDEFEADTIAERVEAAARQRAEKGRPNGRVAYGWDRVYGADVINEAEAEVLRALADAVLSGGKLLPLARDLNAREVPSPSQAGRRRAEVRAEARGDALATAKLPATKPWDGQTIRKLLLREANCGRRVYRGEVLSVNEGMALWSEGQQERLRAILTDPSRRTTRGNEPKRLLSGMLLCGKCGGKCRARLGLPITRDENGKPLTRAPEYYECEKCFGVRTTVKNVDHQANRLILEKLSGEDGPNLLAEDPTAAREGRVELEELRAKLDNAADLFADGEIDREQLRRITARTRPRIEAAERKVAAAMPSPAVARLANRAETIVAAWDGLDLITRRDVVAALATFTLAPAPAKGAKWSPKRLEVRWVGEDEGTETVTAGAGAETPATA